MPTPTITSLPTAPNRSMTPEVFSDTSDVWVAAFALLTGEMNTALAYVATSLTTVASNKSDTAAYLLAAQIAAQAAETSAQTAAGVSGAPMWVSGNSYAFGSYVWSPTSLLSYRRSTPGTTVSNVDPATGTASGWKLANAVSSMPQIEITTAGAYQLLIGYHYRVKNSGAILTMPNGSIQEQVRIEDVSDSTTVQIWPEAGGKFKNRDVALLLSQRGFDRTLTKTPDGWV